MYWLRSAMLYLLLTALLAGSLWLFWGDSVKTAFHQKPVVKKPAMTVKKTAEKKIPPTGMPAQGVDAATEWQKASNGLTNLLTLVVTENRKDAAALAQLQENRFSELLHQMGIKRRRAAASAAATETKSLPVKKPASKPAARPTKP